MRQAITYVNQVPTHSICLPADVCTFLVNVCSILEGHNGWVNDATFAKDGNTVVTISGDRSALVWDVNTGNCINTLEAHSDEVKAVVLTSRGRFAVTGSMDATAMVWDLHAQKLQLPACHVGNVSDRAECYDIAFKARLTGVFLTAAILI